MADEFFQRPGVERLGRGFMAQQVVGGQIVKAIREAVHGVGIGGRTRHAAPFDDENDGWPES